MEKRSKSIYFGSIAILVLVVVGFFIGPVISAFTSNQRAAIVFGKYGNQEVRYIAGNYFAEEVNFNAFQRSQEGTLDDFSRRLVWRQSFDAALTHAAILREVERADVDISAEGLDKRIAQHVRFQRDGQFDVRSYRALNTQERARFRAVERERYLREKYIQGITTEVLVSSNESDFFRDAGLEERQFDFTRVTEDDIGDDDVMEYVVQNERLFERIRVAEIEINAAEEEAEQMRAEITDDGSNFYEKRDEINALKELDTEAESEWLFFSELEQRYPGAGDLEILRTTPLQEVSMLISYGEDRYLVFLVEQRQPYDTVDTEELYSYARIYMQTQDAPYVAERLSLLVNKRRTLADENSANSLSDAGAENDFEVYSSDFFPLNYGNIALYSAVASDAEGYLDGIENNRDFLQSVFALEVGEISEPITHRGDLFLVQVTDTRSVPEEEFDDFKTFYENQLARYVEEDIEDLLVQRDLVFDNFDAVYDDVVAPPAQ